MVSPRVWAGMDEYGWFGSRIVWMTGKIGMVKCVWVCVYAPVNEKGMKFRQDDVGKILGGFRSVTKEV